jgi:tetratricopeptide (TPR) repeat protein
MFRTITLFVLLLFTNAGQGQEVGKFEVTEDIREAYKMVIDLRLEPAKQKIEAIKENDPDNLLVYFVENYIDFFQIFILEEKEDFKRLEKNKNLRLEKIRSGDTKDPFYLFCEAEINIHWAIARLKFNEKIKAAGEMYRAYSLLEENKKRFPDFVYNDKSLSIIHVMAQSLPGIIRKVLDIDGSIEEGTKEIRELYQITTKSRENIFKDEVAIVYAYILFHQNNKKVEAWNILRETYGQDNISSPVIRFVIANMAHNIGKTDRAISLLENAPLQEGAIPFYYLDFLLGKWKLNRLDQGSDIHIKKYVDSFQGQHYLKEAYQKLAWYNLVVKEDFVGYKQYIGLVKKYGENLVDEDKQAEEEFKSGDIPHPDLLKARLLYDGGYYNRAYDYLVKKAFLFSGKKSLLEYNYRLGRITQALKNYPDALGYFDLTLQSTNKKSYYLCNAALQCALILEEQKKYEKALEYIETCLDLKPKKYQSSIHQKAKSARERILSLRVLNP